MHIFSQNKYISNQSIMQIFSDFFLGLLNSRLLGFKIPCWTNITWRYDEASNGHDGNHDMNCFGIYQQEGGDN